MPELLQGDFRKLTGSEFIHLENFPVNIAGVSTDSRSIQQNEIFWVLQGEHFDGHDFVEVVQNKKPAFCVIARSALDRFNEKGFPLFVVPDTLTALQQLAGIQRQKFDYPVLALSGSNGKTSTKEMIAAVLGTKYRVHKTEGNFNNHIGCPLTLLKMEKDDQVAVIEMGTNHPGEIASLAEMVQPSQALLTNIGAAHLEFFNDLDTVAGEKLSLFDCLPPDGLIYKNLDDPFIQKYNAGDRKIVSYAFDHKADITGEILELDEQGNGLFLLNGDTQIRLNVPGLHNVHNALAAATVGLQYGLSGKEIKNALESYTSTNQRMQVLDRSGIRFINDAYNANPDSVMAAIDALSQMKSSGSVYIILGDMLELGMKSRQMHLQVIARALSIHPKMVMVMGQEMVAAAKKFPAVQTMDTQEQIIELLQKTLQQGDLVLLKGSRGMRMEKILNGFN